MSRMNSVEMEKRYKVNRKDFHFATEELKQVGNEDPQTEKIWPKNRAIQSKQVVSSGPKKNLPRTKGKGKKECCTRCC